MFSPIKQNRKSEKYTKTILSKEKPLAYSLLCCNDDDGDKNQNVTDTDSLPL